MNQVRYGIFEWDADKECENQLKHGMNFSEATLAFSDPKELFAIDAKHSSDEQRWFCFGKVGQRVATIRFTIRSGRIRLLGAGFWRKGEQVYEKENTKKKASRLL